jgi:hypothetical protein
MEQSVSIPPEVLIRSWRTATLIASAIAAIELVVILILGVALLGKPLSDRLRDTAKNRSLGITTSKPTRPRIGSSAPQLSRAETTVLVLNGNGVTGAAHEAAARIESRGYSIGHVGNAQRSDFTRSVVMYRPGYRGEAERLGEDLGVKRVGPLDGVRAAALQGAHVAFVVGRS